MKRRDSEVVGILKAPTGVVGLDEVTDGGLPAGRPTLVCGGAGSGKTLLGMSVILNGILKFHEPGVIMTFEETAEELEQNVRSLGLDVGRLIAQKKLVVDYVHIDRSEIEETGEYDLEALFVRIEVADTPVKVTDGKVVGGTRIRRQDLHKELLPHPDYQSYDVDGAEPRPWRFQTSGQRKVA